MATQKKIKAYPVRFNDTTLLNKIAHIANANDRTIRGQIENTLKQLVADYEAEHGEIIISDDDLNTPQD